MKRIIVTLMSVALLVSLAGCRSTTSSGSSSSEAQSAFSFVNPFTMTATNGTPENHITYVAGLPVSYMKQGVQNLLGDGGWYFDVEEKTAIAPDSDELKEHCVNEMYVNKDAIPVVKEREFPRYTNRFISSNGDWDFFPTKVRYESYTLENQPNKPEWDQYFKSLISINCDNTPLIYINAWFFDWNGDGTEDAYVNASNIYIDHAYDFYPNPPYYDSTGTYTLTVLFLSGSEPICRDDDINFNYVSKEALTDDNYVSYYGVEGPNYNYSSERTDDTSEDDYLWSSWVSIQYDSKGDLINCPIFTCGEWGKSWENEIILCDIDGDGKSELITTNWNEYSPMIVYKLIDGKPVEVFRITTPA